MRFAACKHRLTLPVFILAFLHNVESSVWPGNGATHSGMGPPTLMNYQDNCPQAK